MFFHQLHVLRWRVPILSTQLFENSFQFFILITLTSETEDMSLKRSTAFD